MCLCAKRYPANQVHNLCSCGGTLYALRPAVVKGTRMRTSCDPGVLIVALSPVLPVQHTASIVSLGGTTPLIRAHRLEIPLARQSVVEGRSLNPTASFKARGMTTAISMARELGIRKIAILGRECCQRRSRCSRRWNGSAHLHAERCSQANYIECKTLGAQVTLVDGLISIAPASSASGRMPRAFDMSTQRALSRGRKRRPWL
jgi:threonine synthase